MFASACRIGNTLAGAKKLGIWYNVLKYYLWKHSRNWKEKESDEPANASFWNPSDRSIPPNWLIYSYYLSNNGHDNVSDKWDNVSFEGIIRHIENNYGMCRTKRQEGKIRKHSSVNIKALKPSTHTHTLTRTQTHGQPLTHTHSHTHTNTVKGAAKQSTDEWAASPQHPRVSFTEPSPAPAPYQCNVNTPTHPHTVTHSHTVTYLVTFWQVV